MSAGAAIAGSSLLGAISSSRARDAQVDAAGEMADVSRYIFDQQTEMTQPYRDAGGVGLNALMYEFGLGPMPGAANTNALATTGEGQAGATSANMDPTQRLQNDYRSYLMGGLVDPLHDREPWERNSTWTQGDDGSVPFNMSSRRAKYAHEAAEQEAQQANQNALATGTEGGGYGGYTSTPGYQFRFNEGMRAIDSSAAARGGLFSGQTFEDATQFGQNFATEDYQRYLNGLSQITNYGLGGTSQQMAAGNNYAQGMSNALAQRGNAQAAGYIGMGNAAQNGIGQYLGWQAFQGAG